MSVTAIKINLLLSIAFISSGISLTAQHCKYDFIGLVGVLPYVGDTSNIVDGLRITLTDSLGNPIMNSQQVYSKSGKRIESENTPFVFWRNPKPNRDVNHTNDDIQKRHFYFADEHYILMLNHNYVHYSNIKKNGKAPKADQTFYIKIEDTDSLENGGYFEPMVNTVSSERYLPLCGVPLTERGSYVAYQPFYINMEKPIDSAEPVITANPTTALSEYDSTTVVVDTLRDETNKLPVALVISTDYYKTVNGSPTVVKRIVRSNQWLEERIDSWIYEWKDGKLELVDFIQGAE